MKLLLVKLVVLVKKYGTDVVDWRVINYSHLQIQDGVDCRLDIGEVYIRYYGTDRPTHPLEMLGFQKPPSGIPILCMDNTIERSTDC